MQPLACTLLAIVDWLSEILLRSNAVVQKTAYYRGLLGGLAFGLRAYLP